jgi:hypothetical protein
MRSIPVEGSREGTGFEGHPLQHEVYVLQPVHKSSKMTLGFSP